VNARAARSRRFAPGRAARIVAGTACVAALTTSCWPGWTKIFEQTPSREHRVEDMRVLAIETDPGSLVLPASIGRSPPAPPFDGSVDLEVTPRVFDPRGGDVAISVGLCASPVTGQPCSGAGITPVERTLHPDKDKPLGPASTHVTFHLSADDIRGLYRDAQLDPSSLAGVVLQVVVNASTEVAGVVEREQAVLEIEMRTDPFDPLITDAELGQASGARCSDPRFDVVCGQEGPSDAVCGDGVLQAGEGCEPPGVPDLCGDQCQSDAICAKAPAVCVVPLAANVAPRLRGLARGSDVNATDVEFAPGDTIRVGTGDTFSFVVLLDDDQDVHQTVAGPVAFLGGDFEGGPPPPGGGGGRDVENSCPAPAIGQFTCPTNRGVSVRCYIADGDAELVSPVDDLGTYIGNIQNGGGAQSYAIKFGKNPTKEPLVVVVSDGAGGMHIGSFTFDVR
jgi:hypothetical protein